MLNKKGKIDINIMILPLRKYCHFRVGVFFWTALVRECFLLCG